MLAFSPDMTVLALLAAGPMEELLVYHGPAIIEQVEEKAAHQPKFRRLLGGVWKNAIEEGIWARVCKARDAVW